MLPTSSTPQVAIRSVLTEVLPTVLINLVEGYFVFSDATGVLHLGADGKPSDSEANRATLESMQLALTSPECGRDIVRLIFKNAAENGYKSALDELMNQMRLNHQPIILDNVDFSGIDLSGLNLNGASIRNANFTDAILDEASFLGADLTGSQGILAASGNIKVNKQTVVTDTGLFDSEGAIKSLSLHPTYVSLANAPEKENHITIMFGSTKFLILFEYDFENTQ